MTVLSPNYNPGALQQYTSLPGEIYDADSHCRHIFGAGSSLCQVLLKLIDIYTAEREREREICKV